MRLPTCFSVRARWMLCALLCASAPVRRARASAVKEISFDQGGNSIAYFDLLNNDNGVTYDSAKLKWKELLVWVARAVQANNSDYATNSIEEIIAEWGVQVRSPPVGEVKTGWSVARNGAWLEISHAGRNYNKWLSTSDKPDQDEMALTVNFYDQLDFNHNGAFDPATEALRWNGPVVQEAFKGISQSGLSIYTTSTRSVTVVGAGRAVGLRAAAGTNGLAVATAESSVDGGTYHLYGATDLSATNAWSYLRLLPGTGAPLEIPVDTSEPRKFFKLLLLEE